MVTKQENLIVRSILQYTPQNTESRHKKPAPEYPTAGAGIGFRVYSYKGNELVLCPARWRKRRIT